MAVYLLDKNLWFPDPHLGEEDGLVAIGGDLSVDRLILAYYCSGLSSFPMRSTSATPCGNSSRKILTV